MRIVILLAGLVILFFSVILHEVAHGVAAERLGDPTARMMGRITLNPMAHIDPIGTILLPGLMILWNLIFGGVPIFGWAKPVPVNPANLNHPRHDMMWVAAAGPSTNIIIALVLAGLYRLVASPGTLASVILFYGVAINLFLTFFNLIPIPPLDGSRILARFLPERYGYYLSRIEPFGFLIIIVLVAGGVLGYVYMGLFRLSALLTGTYLLW